MKDLNPFDFMNAASFSKEDVIRDSDQPEHTEKSYNAYIINRGFVNFDDCVLHANEMNMRHGLFYAAQFDYYKSVLRKRKRFSKWPKADKDKDTKPNDKENVVDADFEDVKEDKEKSA